VCDTLQWDLHFTSQFESPAIASVQIKSQGICLSFLEASNKNKSPNSESPRALELFDGMTLQVYYTLDLPKLEVVPSLHFLCSFLAFC
jgi:hypothetical protein